MAQNSSQRQQMDVHCNPSEVWLVRHGERIDETTAYSEWKASCPPSRRFDPSLTDTGKMQAREAAESLKHMLAHHPSGGDTGGWTTLFVSPLARTLSTASEIASSLGIRNVVVVPGLCECAKTIRDTGPDFQQIRDMLSFEQMKELCPQVVGVANEAPTTFVEAMDWLVHNHRALSSEASEEGPTAQDERRDAEPVPADGGGIPDDEAARRPALPVLIVTHREGIRDLFGSHTRLPYCAIAHFEASPDPEQANTALVGIRSRRVKYGCQGIFRPDGSELQLEARG